MPDPVTGTIAAVTAGSSLLGASSSNKAAKAQTSAANQATALEQGRYDQMRSDLSPYRGMGARAGGLYESMLMGTPIDQTSAAGYMPTGGALADIAGGASPSAAYTQTPGYDFRLAEGQKAIERSAAARGGALSGSTLKELNKYSQDYASSEYDKYLNRLAGLTGVGQQSAAQTGTTGMSSAGLASQNIMAGGAATASGYTGVANAVGQGVGQLAQYQGMQPTQYGQPSYNSQVPNMQSSVLQSAPLTFGGF